MKCTYKLIKFVFLLFLFTIIVSPNNFGQWMPKIEKNNGDIAEEVKIADNSPKLRPGEIIVDGTHAVLRSSLTFEGFESATFPPTGWTRTIVAGGATQRWVRHTTITGYGKSNGAAQYTFFSSSAGDKQYLQTPDFAASITGEILQFDYAYSTFTGNERDSLVIQTSTDGSVYNDLRILYGDTNTVNIPEENYLITAPRTTSGSNIQDHQWSTMSIPLPVGTISIRFLAISAFGNNLYLDNISTYVPSFGGPLSGTYTINPSSSPSETNYQTFTEAEQDLYNRGVSGPVIFNIASGSYNERFFIRKFSGASSTNTVTFRKSPSEGGDVVLNVTNTAATNSTTDYAIALIGCEWVTLENIKIYDNGTTAATYVNRGIVIGAYAGRYGAKNITIKNCEIGLGGMNVGGTVQVVSTGIVGTGAVNGINSSALSNITIENCKIDNADRGIGFFPFLQTGNIPYPGFDNIIVNNNLLGSIRALGLTITGGGPIGIILQGVRDAVCNNNVIDSLRISATTSTAAITGIAAQIASGVFSGNKIKYLFHANLTSATPILTGIQVGPYSGEVTLVSNNVISGMLRNWTGTATASQIVYGIQGTNFVTGISLNSPIYFVNNSVYLTNTSEVNYTSGAFRLFGAGLPVYSYNNLFWNNLSSNNVTAKHYAVIDANTARTFLASDYNNLLATGTNGFTGRFGTTDALTLNDWKGGIVDLNSVTGTVTFSSLSNLSPDLTIAGNWVLNGRAFPSNLVSNDIDGNPRSTSVEDGVTDIGAYEFDLSVAPPDADASAAPALNSTTVYTAFGDTVCTVTWGATGTVPTSLSVKKYSGVDPVGDVPGDAKYANVYYDINATGGSDFTYDVTFYFNDASLGTVDNDTLLRIAKSDNGNTWVHFSDAVVNLENQTVTKSNLNSFSLFALDQDDAPIVSSLDILNESFEDATFPPTGWTHEYVSATVNWTRSTGNQNNSVTARTGTYLARFYSGNFSQNTTKLVTPSLNLTTIENPRLTYYFTNVNWDGDIDQLRVYYKTSAGGSWTLLSTHTTEHTEWTEVVLSLPSPSSDYYIAFEGKSFWGRGVTLDDVKVGPGPKGQFNDGSVYAIANPNNGSQLKTNTNYDVVAWFRNEGTTNLANVNIYYDVNLGTQVGPLTINGPLAPGDSASVTFTGANSLSSATAANANLRVYHNVSDDVNLGNDTAKVSVIFQNPVSTFPYLQTFTNPAGFVVSGTGLWALALGTNPNGKAPDTLARANFYNTSSAVPGLLRSPIMDFSNLEKPVMSFFVSYRSYTDNADDQLMVGVSTDGGINYEFGTPAFFNRSHTTVPSLSTLAPSSTGWAPNGTANEWRYETVDLTQFSGNSNVVIAFVGVSAFGNNLFIDNMYVFDADTFYTFSVTSPAGTFGDPLNVGAQIKFTPVPVNLVTGNGNSDSKNLDLNLLTNHNRFSNQFGFINESEIKIREKLENESIANGNNNEVASVTGTLRISKVGYEPFSIAVNEFAVNTSATAPDNSIFTPDAVANRYYPISFTGDDYFGREPYEVSMVITGFPIVHDLNKVYIMRRTDLTGSWVALSTTRSGDTLTASGLTGFGEFALGSVEGNIPVELTSFIANSNGNNVNLEWVTATETNNQGFSVERKIEGGEFESITFIEGKGTTSEMNTYSYVDSKLAPNTYTYRLKQIDYDGSFVYSKEVNVEVNIPTEFTLEQNYPNPFNPSTKIKYSVPFDANVSIEIYDVSGQKVGTLVNDQQTAGYYTVEVSMDKLRLSSGVYIYRMLATELSTVNNFTAVKKMMLLK